MVNSYNDNKVFEDMLEDDFVNVFKPIFCIQRMLGLLGVNIEYGFVTPQTNCYKVYSCVTWLMNSVCILYTVIRCRTQFDSLSTDLPLKAGMLLNGVVSAILAWNSLSYNGHSNSQLYVKLQRIERSLKMINAKRLNRDLYRMSLFSTAISVVLLVMWIITLNKNVIRDFCPTATIASVVSSASYFEIFHIYTIIYFITMRVQYVNEQLAPGKIFALDKGILLSHSDVLEPCDKVGDILVHGMFYILDSFADTMDIFQHAIFFFTFQMLAWQLITVQNLVVSFKMQMSVNIPSFLSTLPSSLVCMTLMLMLCFVSQSLTSNLDKCEELCTTLASSLDEGKSRRNAKRITLLVKGKRDATVFNIFTLNIGLPFHLLAIAASYTIVLLQFAVL